jgi:hypothetical protein
MFQPSVNILTSRKSDELLVDDELIGSWSSDVECKTLSYRKSERRDPLQMLLLTSRLSVWDEVASEVKMNDDGAIYDDDDNSYSFFVNDSDTNHGSDEMENLVNIDLSSCPPPVTPS